MKGFSSTTPLLQIIAEQKRGAARGIYSICSANRWVLEACAREARPEGSPLLIEATCNQVNQFGGYTGMRPADFAQYVAQVADALGFPASRIILGGDHLGPSPWQYEPAESAMAKARQLVSDFVEAGFKKIHLDASMRLGDDPPGALDAQVSADRAADLCLAAERANRNAGDLVYVIGTEVPVPGGAQETEESVQVTNPAYARGTIELFKQVFERSGLQPAWKRVIALVVQPGVEFDHTHVFEYDRQAAAPLSHMIEGVPGMVFEAHSTDYQRPLLLRQLVEDHFAILKVGPALTFAFREAAFALAQIEEEWLGGSSGVELARLIEVADEVMVADPKYWARYYPGTEREQAFARKYSLSDRIRYYWPRPEIEAALQKLIGNLESHPAPLSLVSQYMPAQYWRIREGLIANNPSELIRDHIGEIARQYRDACE